MAPSSGEPPKPSSGSHSNASSPRQRPSCLGRVLRTFVLLGILLAGAGGIAAWQLWRFVHSDLAPAVEKQLETLLQRENVTLGDLESVTPYSLTFGPSAIAATATDPDEVTAEAVLVNFNLLELIATGGKLGLDVTLLEPDLYMEQEADGTWVSTDFNIQPAQGPLQVSLQQLKFKGGDVVAVPYGETGLNSEATVSFQNVAGRLKTPRNNAQLLRFEADGDVLNATGETTARLSTSGDVDLSGNESASRSDGSAAGPEIDLKIKGRDLYIGDVKKLLENNVPLPESEFSQGRVDADLKLTILPNQDPLVVGKVDFRDVTVKVPQLPQPVSQVKGSLTMDDADIQLKTATGLYGPLSIKTQGQIHLDKGYNLTAQVQSFELPDAIDYLEIALPAEVAGRAKVQDIVVSGPLETPLITGRLDAISQVVVDQKVPFKAASSRFTFQDSVIGLQEMRAVPVSGGLITGSGEIILSGGQAGADGRIRLDTTADGLSGDDLVNLYSQSALPFRIGELNAQARVDGPLTGAKTTVRFQALKGDYPARGLAVLADGKVDVQDVLIRARGGTLRGGGELLDDRLRGRVQMAGVELEQFSDALRGDLEGDFTFSGPVAGLSPETLEAEGIVTLSEGISIINEPLTTRVNWEGDRLRIARAAASGFEASGLIYASFEGSPAITRLDLDVDAKQLELASLPSTLGLDLNQLPTALEVGGTGSFRGKLTGTPEQPRMDGFVALRQFQVNAFPFDSRLDGSVAATEAGVELKLAGARDRIELSLDSQFQPQNFLVSQGEAKIEGDRVGPDQLRVNLDNFALALLDFKPAKNIEALAGSAVQGTASGEMLVSLNPLTADGSISIDAPSLGALQGDCFSGEFSLNDNGATLQNAALIQGSGYDNCQQLEASQSLIADSATELQRSGSRYEVTGSTSLGSDPQFTARLAIVDGDTRSILETLQWFDFGDVARGLAAPTYGTAKDLQVTPVGLRDAPLITQLQRFSEIGSLVQRAKLRRREEERIPPLNTLVGQFNGEIDVSGSLSQGLKADFKVLGEDWAWGDYPINRVIVQGEFEDDVVTFQPVRVESNETVVSLTGRFGKDIEQSGQLRADKVPVTVARNFIELPVALTGAIGMEATVSGAAGNPTAVGEINLQEGTINGTAVQTDKTVFSYQNARLRFGGALKLDGPEPVAFRGDIPYALPFSEVTPDSDEVKVSLNVQNEGLAFLDLVTRNQVRWLEGEGSVQLNVGGTLSEPVATGEMELTNASLAAQFLPDAPLTNVTGKMRFVGDRILVDSVQGKFSEGEVTAVGVLPISRPQADIAQPLLVAFEKLDLNLRGLYRGGASGEVKVTGTSLRPELSGDIRLNDGQVLLPDSQTETASVRSTGDGASGRSNIAVGSGAVEIASPSFSDLRLRLGQGVKIAQPPIFSFFAEGDLGLIGTLDDPLLAGDIRLTRGQVNLFTSQFSLETRAENVARFSPDQGLDPLLQLAMTTSATESSRRRSAFENTSTSEIQDTNPTDLGSLQTVRIRANIQGPASQLLDNITLSSSPSRSQAEIVSLIGGGFVDTLGRGGDSTLALANLAGSALLGNIQGVINNALSGPVELRLFPTVVESRDRKEQAGTDSTGNGDGNDDNSTVFALGAEVGVNINNSTSFSALRLLTVDLPTQYNLRYQLNDNLTLRGTTDLQGDNRFVVDYEARF